MSPDRLMLSANLACSRLFISRQNSIAGREEANQGDATGLIRFDSQATLAKVSGDWPLSRFVEIWNSIPGQSPVKKFQDRKKALARVWAAIQPLAGQEQPTEAAAAKPEPSRKAG